MFATAQNSHPRRTPQPTEHPVCSVNRLPGVTIAVICSVEVNPRIERKSEEKRLLERRRLCSQHSLYCRNNPSLTQKQEATRQMPQGGLMSASSPHHVNWINLQNRENKKNRVNYSCREVEQNSTKPVRM